MMISQAWDQHVADRQKVSTTSREVLEVMHEEWMAGMEQSMNDVMVTSVEFPSPLVAEVYTNSQNVLKEAKRRGHVVGSALSLETGWNFLSRLDREAAKKKLMKEEPYFLVLAFPCGAWSQLLNLNPPRDLEGKRKEAKILLMFALELAKMQKQAGRHFVLENPLTSQAWGLREVSWPWKLVWSTLISVLSAFAVLRVCSIRRQLEWHHLPSVCCRSFLTIDAPVIMNINMS